MSLFHALPWGFVMSGKEIFLFQTLLLARQPGNGTLQLRMHAVYLLVEGALYSFNFLIGLDIQHLLFFHKRAYHFA